LGAEADVERRSKALRHDEAALRGDEGRDRAEYTSGELVWLSPLALWTGILTGPIVWAIDLTASYALTKWTCSTQRDNVLHAVMAASLLAVAGGAMVAFVALRHSAGGTPTDGGRPRQRARFMAILGLTISALIFLTVASTAIPQWVLNACD
jgi:hypothetical protein